MTETQYICEWKTNKEVAQGRSMFIRRQMRTPITEGRKENLAGTGVRCWEEGTSAEEMLRGKSEEQPGFTGEEGRRVYSRWDGSMCRVLGAGRDLVQQGQDTSHRDACGEEIQRGVGADHTIPIFTGSRDLESKWLPKGSYDTKQ